MNFFLNGVADTGQFDILLSINHHDVYKKSS